VSIAGEYLTGQAILFACIALSLSLFFEFINGFHDTANAVATVIYTKSLPPTLAVIWSGIWNFIGVLLKRRQDLQTRGSTIPSLVGSCILVKMTKLRSAVAEKNSI
jgi:PiT family inorganic phosphate transporter